MKKVAPKTVEVKVTRMHGGKPWMTDFDNKYVQAAGRAIEKGFGQKPVFNREGGSIPVVATFQEILGLPSVLFGVGLPDENAHAPNEKLDLANFHGGIIASAFLYDEVGEGLTCVPPGRWIRTARCLAAAVGCTGASRDRARQSTQGTYDKSSGKLTQITYDRNNNGTIDTWTDMDGARPLRSRIDLDEDGKIDRWEYYDGSGALAESRLLAQARRQA